MLDPPVDVPDRPEPANDRTDVVSDVLRTAQLTTLFYGRWQLRAPWTMHVPVKATSSFYVLARGRARLAAQPFDDTESLSLSAGDVVLIPRGAGHVLDDGSRLEPPAWRPGSPVDIEALSQSTRLEGRGAESSLVVGCFRFSYGDHPLLRALPGTIHLRSDDPACGRPLAATVELMSAESAERGPGSDLILGRLGDVLLAQALRVISRDRHGPGWTALVDPHIGPALEHLHAQYAAPWTIARLAAVAGLSRSGFSARFHELVGEPPATYLVRLRMTKAATLLRDTDDSVAEIATRVGYDSTPAFRKAFKRHIGVGPGEYRRPPASDPLRDTRAEMSIEPATPSRPDAQDAGLRSVERVVRGTTGRGRAQAASIPRALRFRRRV